MSGLFVRGAAAGASANPGFDLGQLAIAQIEPKLGGYDAAQGREAHRALLEKLRSTPAAAKMFLTLGLAGTFVAVIGLYGVRSYLVSRRTREFGVRMAIGASPADVLSLVVRETLATTIVGLTMGLGLALLLGWGLRVAIYQISPFDPVTLGAATGILAISSLAASIIPARRAANFLPMSALRND